MVEAIAAIGATSLTAKRAIPHEIGAPPGAYWESGFIQRYCPFGGPFLSGRPDVPVSAFPPTPARDVPATVRHQCRAPKIARRCQGSSA